MAVFAHMGVPPAVFIVWPILAVLAILVLGAAVFVTWLLPLGFLGPARARIARRAVVSVILSAAITTCYWYLAPIRPECTPLIRAGMTAQEVQSVLGRPHEGMGEGNPWKWYYYLDWTWDYYFVVQFDSQGRVESTFSFGV